MRLPVEREGEKEAKAIKQTCLTATYGFLLAELFHDVLHDALHKA